MYCNSMLFFITIMKVLLRGIKVTESEKGKDTKKKILNSAKKLFYEQGYTATTVAQITDDAGVNNGLFTYYFGSKSAAAGNIANEYRLNLRNTVSQKMFYLYKQYNLALGIAVEYRKSTEITTSDQNLLRFDIERGMESIDKPNPVRDHFYQLQRRLIQPNISDIDLKFYEILGLPISRALYIAYDSGELNCTTEYMADYMIRLFFSLLQLPPQQIEELVNESRKVAALIDIHVSNYFIVS